VGILLELLVKNFGKKMLVVPMVMVGFYFLGKVNINGFYERRLTTLKRQAMNNFRENELPWNYLAVQEYNQFFRTKDENCYLGSLLNYYYFHLVFNKNCNYLPISEQQDFGSGGMIMDNIKRQSPNLIDYYVGLVKSGKTVYISNYYGSANSGWEADYQKIMNIFNVKKETNGCLGNCSIYKLVEVKRNGKN
jgi:hypothetical protein